MYNFLSLKKINNSIKKFWSVTENDVNIFKAKSCDMCSVPSFESCPDTEMNKSVISENIYYETVKIDMKKY